LSDSLKEAQKEQDELAKQQEDNYKTAFGNVERFIDQSKGNIDSFNDQLKKSVEDIEKIDKDISDLLSNSQKQIDDVY